MSRKSVKLYTDDVLTEFYNHVLNGTIDKLHIPHSDVFYVREAVQNYYGRPFTLEHVEWAMRMEGWTDSGDTGESKEQDEGRGAGWGEQAQAWPRSQN